MSNNWEVTDDTERNEEEDPGQLALWPRLPGLANFPPVDLIPGIPGGPNFDLGEAHPRNPDAYPPTNIIQHLGALISDGLDALARGNCLYAIKAGFLTSESESVLWLHSPMIVHSFTHPSNVPAEFCPSGIS